MKIGSANEDHVQQQRDGEQGGADQHHRAASVSVREAPGPGSQQQGGDAEGTDREADPHRVGAERPRGEARRGRQGQPIGHEIGERGGRQDRKFAREEARARRRGHASLPASNRRNASSSSTGTPSCCRLCQLAARLVAGDEVVGLGADRSGGMAARGADRLLGLLAAEAGERAGDHQGLARERPIDRLDRGAGGRGLRHDAGVEQGVERVAGLLVGEVLRDPLSHHRADPEDRGQLLRAGAPQPIGDALGSRPPRPRPRRAEFRG